MAITGSDVSGILKRIYGRGGAAEIAFNKKTRPFLSRLAAKANWNWRGDGLAVPIVHGSPPGGSHTLATTITNSAEFPNKQWFFQCVNAKNYYEVATLDTKLLRAAKSADGAFVRTLTQFVNRYINAMANKMAYDVFRLEDGSRGTIDSTTNLTSTTLVLADPADHINFNIGDKIVTAADNTSALRNSGAAHSVTGVTRGVTSSTLTVAANLDTTAPAIATGDTIWKEGDYVSASDTLALFGLASWVPAAAPSDTIFGVTRTTDPTNLAGHRLTGYYSAIAETIRNAVLDAWATNGQIPTYYVMHPSNMLRLQNELEASVDRKAGGQAVSGFSSFMFDTPVGTVEVEADPQCQTSIIWGMNMEDPAVSPQLLGIGEAPDVFRDDGNEALRGATTDDVQVRVVGYVELALPAPGTVQRVTLS